MFLGRFFKGRLIEFTAMSLISLLLYYIYTVEGCVGQSPRCFVFPKWLVILILSIFYKTGMPLVGCGEPEKAE